MLNEIPDYDQSDEQKVDLKAFKGAQQVGSTLVGWNQLNLKQEIKKAMHEIGFQYPSQVQKQAIPIIMQGKDLICQARSGMGKTAVFVVGVLNQLSIKNGEYIPFNCLVLCHTRELAHQIFKDFRRLSRYFVNPNLRIGCYFGGIRTESHRIQLQKEKLPHIIIGTPGRLWQLIRQKLIPLNNIDFFIVDECDVILQSEQMKKIVKKMYPLMKHSKQVMMFSATFSQKIVVCAKNFMNNPQQIFVDPGKLVLAGLSQFNKKVMNQDKLDVLMEILDKIEFNQGVIFVNKVEQAKKLNNYLRQKLFNTICLHSGMTQQERIMNYDKFKQNNSKLLVATDVFGRGNDIQRINLVINFDLPKNKQIYLHRIGRAGRFNTKGIAINFVRPIGDQSQIHDNRIYDVQVMYEIEKGLHNKIPMLPEKFDSKMYI